MKLTKRQQQVLDIIKQALQEQGIPPTRAEIAQILGFKSANAAEDHLKALARKGAIEILPGTSRGIRVLETAAPKANKVALKTPAANIEFLEAELPSLPVLGQVAAGSPTLAQENIDFHLQIDPNSFTKKADYLLKVKGLSMLNLGILEGDLLAVHLTQEPPRNGQLVVARIDDEVTVKRFRQEGYLVWLLAENPDFAPIKVDLRRQELNIEGLAVGLIRNQLDQQLH